MHGLSVLARLQPKRPANRILKIPRSQLKLFKRAVKDAYIEGYIEREIEAGPSVEELSREKAWKKSGANRELKTATAHSKKKRCSWLRRKNSSVSGGQVGMPSPGSGHQGLLD